MKLALCSLLLSLLLTAPAAAADRVVQNTDPTGIVDIDSYRDRVAWTQGDDLDAMELWTLERGSPAKLNIAPISQLDVAAGPRGQAVAVYRRCAMERCRFYRYDFDAKRERRIKGAPTGDYGNWRFWGNRFALIRHNRFVVVGANGISRDIGRARSLNNNQIDFNGEALTYVNSYLHDDEDHHEYELSYFPVVGKGRILKTLSHGASGERWLNDARIDERHVYATEIPGEFGGPTRLWRTTLEIGKQQYAALPSNTLRAVHVGTSRALSHVCDEDEHCELVLSTIHFRDR